MDTNISHISPDRMGIALKATRTAKGLPAKNNPIQSTPLIFSFFSGAGFLDLGFEKAGYTIAFVNEIHKPFLYAYQYSRQKMTIPDPLYGYFNGDIEQCLTGKQGQHLSHLVNAAKVDKRLVGFIGGPPCPDFSVGGKNRGQHGENGKLSQIYVDLICKQKPDFFVFENVKGLYRTTRHRQFFEGLKHQLKEAGYSCTERLINAIEYGAPQDRERIILFGAHQSRTPKNIAAFDWCAHTLHPEGKALSYPWPNAEPIAISRPQPQQIPVELTIQHWFDKNDVGHHPNALHQFKPRAGLAKFETVYEGDDSKKSYKRLRRWRYSPTAAYGNNEVHIHPYLPRRISVAEALAIQSLPKEFELPADMTLSNMFKTVGNGVPFLAGRGLAMTILDFFNGVGA
ncbi:MAG: DNA cytosine methyltransferase [Methylovulum sp.]|nr:DNA cytosine methyltransferase [Methylovulum sp.]